MSQIGSNFFGSYVMGSGMGALGYGGQGLPAITQAYEEPISETKPVKPEDPIDRSWMTYGGLGAQGQYPGYDKAPPPSIPIWWQMRRYATIVLAQAITTGPILAGEQTIEIANDKGNKAQAEEMQELATKHVLPFIKMAMGPGFECLNFGWWLQEVLWDRDDDGTYPCEARTVLPGEATIYRDKYRRFAGYEINGEYRDTRYGFLAVNNPHIDPIFGESRNEYCREEWWRARQSELNADSIEKKASGIQMAIGFPMGQTWYAPDSSGVPQPVMQKDMMQTIMNTAAQGGCFSYPMTVFPMKECLRDPKLLDIPGIKVTPFDWGNNGPMMMAQLSRISALDMKIMQARMRPTREAMEGTTGTKAEAGVHGQIGVTDSEMVAAQMLGQLTCQVLDRWAVTNFGPKAAGVLYAKQAPLSDPQQVFLQQIYTALASGQSPDPELIAQINPRALGDRVEMPMRSQEDTDAKIAEQQQQKQVADQQQHEQQMAMLQAKGAAQPGANGQNGKPMNGKPPVGLSADDFAHDLFERITRA